MRTCFVYREYNPITEKYGLRILNCHADQLHPCACNPDPIMEIHRVWKNIVSGYEPIYIGEAEKFIETYEE